MMVLETSNGLEKVGNFGKKILLFLAGALIGSEIFNTSSRVLNVLGSAGLGLLAVGIGNKK
ncbi:hypothetical protein HC823_01920 [Candidatus Gracilibacteria bacterium]|nr:hypothetical protein [Candidatus Gracilibacteria bacterium]